MGKIRGEYVAERLEVSSIMPDHVPFAVAREARMAEVRGRDEVGVIRDEELGVCKIIEIVARVDDLDSRERERFIRLRIDRRRAEDIFLEDDPYGHTASFCFLECFDNPFLGEDVDLDRYLALRTLDERDESVERLQIWGCQDLDVPRLDPVRREGFELGLDLSASLQICFFLCVKCPVLIGTGGEEEWEKQYPFVGSFLAHMRGIRAWRELGRQHAFHQP